MMVIIPAYKPGNELIALIGSLNEQQMKAVVVDDGSGQEKYGAIFDAVEKSGAVVLHHAQNQGKGRALKTGIQYVMAHYPNEDVVTADADGQHSPKDILRLAEAMKTHNDQLIIGVRQIRKMPLRSKMGNSITRFVFSLISRRDLSDTQTGLRGIPSRYLDWAYHIEGERFEYEMNMLLYASSDDIKFLELPIDTVYIDNNKGTHFNSVKDAFRIYKTIIKYSLSSFSSFCIDYILVLGLNALTGNLFISVYSARTVSTLTNYLINRRMVFKKSGGRLGIVKHCIIAVCSVTLNYLLLRFFTEVCMLSLVYIKPVVDLGLFFLGFMAQKYLVYKV